MKLVTMILTVVALAACNVAGPGAGEAKVTPPVPSDTAKMDKQGWVVWVEAEQKGYDDLLLAVGLDRKNKTLSIRGVDFDGFLKYKPLSGHGNCIDHYDNVQRSGGVQNQEYKAIKPPKVFTITITNENEVINLYYVVQDTGGNTVTYRLSERALPVSPSWENLFDSEDGGLLEDGEDCDHVSQSGEEEGSAAP